MPSFMFLGIIAKRPACRLHSTIVSESCDKKIVIIEERHPHAPNSDHRTLMYYRSYSQTPIIINIYPFHAISIGAQNES